MDIYSINQADKYFCLSLLLLHFLYNFLESIEKRLPSSPLAIHHLPHWHEPNTTNFYVSVISFKVSINLSTSSL